MIVIESAVATKAAQATIWNRWIDLASWREWNPSLVDITLHGGFNVGSHGTLQMSHGQQADFEITYVEPDKGFDMVSQIFCGTLIFQQRIESVAGVQRMAVTVITTGWASWIYGYSMRYALKKELPACLTKLALLVERDQARVEQELYDAQSKGQ